jgi:hypothetical protein
MGSWSELRIGEIVFAWKYHVPTFLTFVFSQDDLFIEREQLRAEVADEDERVEVDPDEPYIEKGGYRTTVGRAKAVLNSYGYTVPFFAEIYQSVRNDLDAQVRDRLDDELGARAGPDVDEDELKARIEAHMSARRTRPSTTCIHSLHFSAMQSTPILGWSRSLKISFTTGVPTSHPGVSKSRSTSGTDGRIWPTLRHSRC